MATVRFNNRGDDGRLKDETTTINDQVERIFLGGYVLRTEDRNKTPVSFQEMFYSREFCQPGLYFECCGCSRPGGGNTLVDQMLLVLDEIEPNKYSVRIYGHNWGCTRKAYYLLRQGKLYPKEAWGSPQAKSADHGTLVELDPRLYTS